MSISFHPAAELELDLAIDYYEDCQPALGNNFALEVLAALQTISQYPYAWPILEDCIRRCLINRFPFAIVYNIEENDEIFILSIMHLRQDPKHWHKRKL